LQWHTALAGDLDESDLLVPVLLKLVRADDHSADVDRSQGRVDCRPQLIAVSLRHAIASDIPIVCDAEVQRASLARVQECCHVARNPLWIID
jgi:hypothetical protein